MGIKFYSSDWSPPCRAVKFTLKTLGVDFELNEVDFANGGNLKPDFLEINVRGKIPGLDDNGLKMGESRAIMQFLCNEYEKSSDNPLYSKYARERAVVDQVIQIDADAVAEFYKYAQPYEILVLGKQPCTMAETDVRKYFEVYEKFLSKTKYLAADHLTIADISAIASITILDLCDFDNYGDFPKLKAWLEKMRSLPHFEECIGKPNSDVKEMYQAKINSSK